MDRVSIPRERKKQLKKLARLMNKQNKMPVPPMRGIIELLDYDVTDQELDFLLRLGTKARTIEQIASVAGMDMEACEPLVDQFIRRGFLWGEPGVTGSDRIELAPIVVGWLELQLLGGQTPDKSLEFSRRMNNLFSDLKNLNFFPLRNITNLLAPKVAKPYQSIGAIQSIPGKGKKAVIQINRNVNHSSSTVFPISDAYELVDRHGANNQVGVMTCFCRKWRGLLDDPCRFDLPEESCIIVGPITEHAVEYGFGRKIEKNDALKLMEELAKGGVIHTLFHEKDDTRLPNVAICNCCWDCCGLYGAFNRATIPLYFKSHYLAQVTDPDSCKACNKCVKHCPTNAITLINDRPVIQESICIGCGQCALQCPTNSFTLKPFVRDVVVPLIKNSKARLL